MAYGVKLLVWGDYASFNRPEMKVERMTYEVITPSAARGILEAIYWKPGFRWVIDVLHVLAPIRFAAVRRNEIKGVIPTQGALANAMKGDSVALGTDIAANRQQRAATILRKVRYGIEAHIEVLRPDAGEDGQPLSHPEAKHLETFRRRASKGQFFHQPYFGTREFPAHFEWVENFERYREESPRESRDLGLMLHDIEYVPDPKSGKIVESNAGMRLTAVPRFFQAVMRDGTIRVPALKHEGRMP